MKKILFDISAIKTGGGAQRALNFLQELQEKEKINFEIWVLKTKNYFSFIDKKFDKIIDNPKNYLLRSLYEYFYLKFKLNKENFDVVFTFTGSGLPKSSAVSIIGVNYPIICYSESKYWDYLALSKRIIQKIKNYFRIKRIGNADIIFLQTKIMKERISGLYPDKNIKYHIIPPSPSLFVNKVKRNGEPNFLLLSSNDPHKNLWRLYEVALVLRDLNFKAKFYISVNREEYIESLKKGNKIDKTILDEYFKFLGRIESDEIQGVYNQCSYMLQLSDLESFSNNYMEAWKAEIPLIVSDRDFARHICKNSAMYVEPHNPNDVAQTIIELHGDNDNQNTMIEHGRKLLKKLPEQNAYLENILKLISNAFQEKN